MEFRLIQSVAIVAVALLVPRTSGEPWVVCREEFGTFTPRSRFFANLQLIAATLPRNASASPDLYATAVDVGAIPEQVSAAALCRGDVSAKSCLSCLTQAFADLPNACSNTKDATIYYDRCMVIYSDIHFLSDDDPRQITDYTVNNNGKVVTELDRYNCLVAALANATADYAAYNSTRLYASGEVDFNKEFPKVYSWAQCRPDLTPARCRSCLAEIMAQEIWSYKDNIGGRTLSVRCSFRVETEPFLNGTILVRLPATTALSGSPPAPPSTTAVGVKTEKQTPRRIHSIAISRTTPSASSPPIAAQCCSTIRAAAGLGDGGRWNVPLLLSVPVGSGLLRCRLQALLPVVFKRRHPRFLSTGAGWN
uniref:Gnk2-homologous domain-containing protein n=1 Tax=Oryza nivara TaxID=4536 RepID=A0A0E0J4G0_ORYNI